MIVMAPSDEAELIHMVATAAAMDRHPICFRFPRGNALGVDLAAHGIIGYKGQPMPVRSCAGEATGICYGGSDDRARAQPHRPALRTTSSHKCFVCS